MGKLKVYHDKGKDDNDVFAPSTGRTSCSRRNSYTGDICEEEDIVQSHEVGSSGVGSAGSAQDEPGPAEDRSDLAQDAQYSDCINKDMARIKTATKRLLEAIDGEFVEKLVTQLKRFLTDRENLKANGKVVFDIYFSAHSQNRFKITRSDGGSFQKQFKVGDYVTIFEDYCGSCDAPDSKEDGYPDSEDTDDDAGCSADDAGSAGGSAGELHAPPPPGDGSRQQDEGGNMEDRIDDTAESNEGNSTDDGSAAKVQHGQEPLTRTAPPWKPGPRFCEYTSPEARKAAEELEQQLKQLGLSKFCVAHIEDMNDLELVVYVRPGSYDETAGELEDILTGSKRWALSEAIQDVALRRQAEATEELAQLCSSQLTKATAVAAASATVPASIVRRRDEEVRFLQLLICNPRDADDRASAVTMSSAGVQWLDEPARQEVEAVLSSMRLNEDQKGVLQKAAQRSVTLLQGPPGTGKTYTLAAMGAALCQVFHDPNRSCFAEGGSRPDFELPCSKNNMANWTGEEVALWIRSFRNEKLRDASLISLERVNGQIIYEGNRRWLKRMMTDDGVFSDERTPDEAAWKDAAATAVKDADRLATAFLELRDGTLKALADRQAGFGAWATGFWRTSGRDMRIIMCADTNIAANRLLESLVKQLPADASYNIIRLGAPKKSKGDTESSRLAAEYNVDHRVQRHPLMKIAGRLHEAMTNNSKVTAQLGPELQVAVYEYAEAKRREAQEADRPLVLEKWTELSEAVKAEIAPKVLEVTDELLKVIKASQKRRTKRDLAVDIVRAKVRKLRAELREIALYDILVPVQVVVGTNTSMGEIRRLCSRRRLSFPIVLMDEAGQATEPSCLIPLTLGAEWALVGGDMAQLPPTILSETARKVLGFFSESGGSQYGRFRELGVLERSLTLQYRMHPGIRQFPSRAFYGSRLREDPNSPPDTNLPQFRRCAFRWPSDEDGPHPVVFLDVGDGEEKERDNSFYNVEEANLALQLLLAVATDSSVESVVILTPYNGQVKMIEERLNQAQGVIASLRGSHGTDDAGTSKPSKPLHLAVHTVDGFQGHEADVILMSMVRTGDSLGFLKDKRRLNVAITRARRGLIILGRAALLSRRLGAVGKPVVDNYWPMLLDDIKRKNGFVPCPEVRCLAATLPALPNEMACTVETGRPNPKLSDYMEQPQQQRQQKQRQRKPSQQQGQGHGTMQGQGDQTLFPATPQKPVTLPKPQS